MGRDPSKFLRVILICTGSECKKAGAKEIAKEVRNLVRQLGEKKTTHVVRTRCNDMCEQCPVVSFQPENLWITGPAAQREVFRRLGRSHSDGG